MALNAISLCSRALLRIGCTPLGSFDDQTSEADIAAALYPHVRDSLLSAYPWSFATAQATLARLEASPVADYAYAYALPADYIRILSAGGMGAGQGLEYRLMNTQLLTNSDMVTLTYIFRPNELDFPPFFDAVLIYKLAADFAIPLTESASRAELFFKLADDEYKRAKQIDAQQDTPRRIENFPLIDARGA